MFVEARFDPELLKAYMKKLIPSTLQGQRWDSKDKDQQKAWCKEISERVKGRMLEMQPKGFKYVVTTIVNENLGQGGRADMVCHWEDNDVVAQEMWSNGVRAFGSRYDPNHSTIGLDYLYLPGVCDSDDIESCFNPAPHFPDPSFTEDITSPYTFVPQYTPRFCESRHANRSPKDFQIYQYAEETNEVVIVGRTYVKHIKLFLGG
ncbi:hypothetical protein FRB99_006181 [Tulasnella sp. 403]|nr:hypothetical protein FRB99_006181 [Tulasnella sp. 403]